MQLGVHVSIAGGFLQAVARAQRLSCTTMQMFSRSPRGGQAPAVTDVQARRFDAARRSAHIDPLAVHSPYIINLASPDAWMWQRSVALYCEEVARVTQLGAQYLVTHVGSHRGQGASAGISRVAEAIRRALDHVRGSVTILLENTAGSGQGLGHRFEELADIRAQVNANGRVGVCLDTAHLFAAGYPLHTAEGLEETVTAFDQVVGLEHLHLIHLNDSKAPFASHVDRHWHIGDGHIGLEAFGRILTHPRLKGLPFILETPKSAARPSSLRSTREGDAEDRRNLATVRRLAAPSGGAHHIRGVHARHAV